MNCFLAGEALGLGEQGRALSFRALGIAGDQLIELGDRLVMLALLGQDLGAEHGRAFGPSGQLGQLGDGGLGAGEIAGMQLEPGLAGARRREVAAGRIGLHEPGELVLRFLDAVGLDQGQLGQDLGLAKQGGLKRKRLAGRLGRGLLEQFGRLGQLPARLHGPRPVESSPTGRRSGSTGSGRSARSWSSRPARPRLRSATPTAPGPRRGRRSPA